MEETNEVNMMQGEKGKNVILAENATVASSEPPATENKTQEFFKPKRKQLKKFGKKKFLKKKVQGNPQLQGKRVVEKIKSVDLQPCQSDGREDRKEKEPMGEDDVKDITKEKQVGESQKINRKKVKVHGLHKEQQNHKNKGELDGSGKSSGKQNSKREQGKKSTEKNEKLGGFIFMCNAKTKPDCFRYRVMGVSSSKKDLVLGIKPGMKLFLYDYDLKLLYGIYEAASSGGMKLEPAAFQGGFPFQVRFKVQEDCYPLPESVFKKAIKENYNEKQKFKTELTAEQIKKLKRLFKPANIRSNGSPSGSTPMAIVRGRVHNERARETGPHSYREPYARDAYVDGKTRSYTELARGRDHYISYRGVASAGNEDLPLDSFMTEKDYRTHGLRRDAHLLAAPVYVPAADGERVLRPQVPIVQREPVQHDPQFLTEQEYRIYGLGSRREVPPSAPIAVQQDPYYNYDRREVLSSGPPATTVSLLEDPYYDEHAAAADVHLPPSRREVVSSGSHSLGGRREPGLGGSSDLRVREIDEAGRYSRYATDDTERYSRYAYDALAEYNRGHNVQGARLDTAYAPVSSRYAFAGPSSRR